MSSIPAQNARNASVPHVVMPWLSSKVRRRQSETNSMHDANAHNTDSGTENGGFIFIASAAGLDKGDLIDLLQSGNALPHALQRGITKEAHTFVPGLLADFAAGLLG